MNTDQDITDCNMLPKMDQTNNFNEINDPTQPLEATHRETTSEENAWTLVTGKRRKQYYEPEKEILPDKNPPKPSDKISEPCWFFNTGGCRHKDGTEKGAHECKYLHIISSSVKRPPHLNNRKPCDKFNLEGICYWNNNCKYSHRNLTAEEWSKYYPGIPHTLKNNINKRNILEAKLGELESRIKILEYKISSMDEHFEVRLNTLRSHYYSKIRELSNLVSIDLTELKERPIRNNATIL